MAPLLNTFGYDTTQFGGSVVPTDIPAVPSTLNSGNIAPVTPINYKTPNPTPTYPVDSLDTTVPTPPAAATPQETKASGLTDSLQKLNEMLLGKSAYKSEQETAAGVQAAQKTVTDLAAQLTGLQNEAKAIPLSLQNDATGRGITAAGLAPIQAEQLRNNAVKSLTVSTLLEAAKGNLANAQSIADRAVAQKYDPIQERITAAKSNLDLILNDPETKLEEKNRAQKQLDIQNSRQAKLDKAKEDDKTILKTAQDAAANGADAVTLQKITSAKTPAEALKIAGTFGIDKASTQVVEINGRKVLINSKTGSTIKDLGAATGSSETGTVSERQQAKLQQYSSVFIPGAKLTDGTPVLDTNGFLNPAAFKSAIADYGGDRADFIKKYGYLLYSPSGTPDSKYGLTQQEAKLISAA